PGDGLHDRQEGGGVRGRFVGRLPGSQGAPDLIAAGASLSVAVLLALGLEQSGFLRASMGVTSVLALLFFLVVGGSHTEQNTAHLHHAISSEVFVDYIVQVSTCLVPCSESTRGNFRGFILFVWFIAVQPLAVLGQTIEYEALL
ncbi:uncharacterized protein LOC119569993, partial [Penaeus monodon]|uniref:uncharacterized protein LOC119569993 n=1 Tax=Penaeus monodon TaxID=6687 RepID=UPI0018A70246